MFSKQSFLAFPFYLITRGGKKKEKKTLKIRKNSSIWEKIFICRCKHSANSELALKFKNTACLLVYTELLIFKNKHLVVKMQYRVVLPLTENIIKICMMFLFLSTTF